MYSCSREVFPTAVVIMDTFTAHVRMGRDTYQLLGATAMHIASKLVGPSVLTAQVLCDDMDLRFSVQDMKVIFTSGTNTTHTHTHTVTHTHKHTVTHTHTLSHTHSHTPSLDPRISNSPNIELERHMCHSI